jgi:SAM-dependent methyltransferase
MAERRTSHCPICDSLTENIGTKRGGWRPLDYDLARCNTCGFTFVTNPSTDFHSIYDAAYYRGEGADPMVDYVEEMERPDTIRRLEWEGVAESVARLVPLDRATRWLDYGCGMGGLVNYLTCVRGLQADGYDTGMPEVYAKHARGARVDDAALATRSDFYDVVSAIEVLEHVLDPSAVLREIERLLKPGGVFFYTTGNAEKFRNDMVKWQYVRPEIHVSFFEPRTLRFIFGNVGLEPIDVAMNPGLRKIVTFKVLKQLRRRRFTAWMNLLPWRLIARVVDLRYGFTDLPMARKPRHAPQ